MESLRSALGSQESLQLGVAAMGTAPFEPFDEDSVRYFHLEAPFSRSGFGGVLDRWRHNSDDRPRVAEAFKLVDDFEPDLIHVHGSEGPFGLLAERTPVPVLISLQGVLHIYSKLYFAGVPRMDVLRDVMSMEFAKGRGLVHASWNMSVQARRELRILGSCDFFAGRTEWDRASVAAVNPDAQYYQAEEVLRPEFYGVEWQPSLDGPFVIYTTGGPAPYKGLVHLLEAVAQLRNSLNRDVKLRISGRILDTHMWPIAQRAVARLHLENAVSWLGPLPPAAIAAELMATSVYVHPSLIDNSPNSLAEAMTVGVPCVASAVGGIPSMVDDGGDGLLCRSNDVTALVEAMAAVQADTALATRLGANARVRALVRHNPASIARATTEMYQDVIARRAVQQVAVHHAVR
jgi:glycosyltransferase involved in cell wall biosynthesis